ncbi:zinc-finger domain-containing protein [Bacillus sp. 2205SS5-2]|uniref:zinc-finger domain-containing protein n=1 Tax=Bacillus sp. 2205SS5-2 TaxID=3109031 RepID=UPI003004F17B
MKRKTAIIEADNLMDTYCEGCWLKREFRKEKGKTEAHRFCIGQCTIGAQLQELGKKISQ